MIFLLVKVKLFHSVWFLIIVHPTNVVTFTIGYGMVILMVYNDMIPSVKESRWFAKKFRRILEVVLHAVATDI